jgi:hypothetical protein
LTAIGIANGQEWAAAMSMTVEFVTRIFASIANGTAETTFLREHTFELRLLRYF